MLRRILRPAALLLAAAVVQPPRFARADDVDDATARKGVEAVLAQTKDDDVAALWAAGKRLSDDKLAIPALRALAATASAGHRLAIGRALVLLQDETKGVEVLVTLVKDDAAPVPVRAAALKVIGRFGEEEQAEWLEKAVDDALDPSLKMAMAKALWQLGGPGAPKAKAIMLDFLRSESRERREEGALALGEIGAAAEAKATLQELRDQPTERGRTAALLLELLARESVDEGALRTAPPPPPATPSSWPLLDEIRQLLEQTYVLPEKLRDQKLEDFAAEGFTKALDEHSNYLTPAEHARLLESLDPTYGGVGAYVHNDPDNREQFTISRPIWGGPLYKAGLRTGDVVTHIDGEATFGLSVDECVRRLKGPAGTKVVVSIVRPGWAEKQDFTLTRANITIPTISYDLLPGPVGYLQILSFGEETPREVHRILDEFAAAKVKGVVLDLRWNPGGLLRAAVDIASEFLPAGRRVVSEKGREGVWPEKVHESTGAGASREQAPLVVLVNAGTASASEILSGALRHHQRARLVGTQTYGKGSVQIPVDLKSRPGEPFTDTERLTVLSYSDVNGNNRLDPGEPVRTAKLKNGRYDPAEKFTDANGNGVWDEGEAFVDGNSNGVYDVAEPFEDRNKNGRWDPGGAFKPTVALYYLPDGTHLDGHVEVKAGKVVRTGGIVPDVELKDDPRDLWEFQAQSELYRSGAIRTYVDAAMAKDPALFETLGRSDRRDPEAYPGFDAWYDTLGTKLSKQAVRSLVRLRVRENIADRIGRALEGDVVDDAVLRAGVVELLRQVNLDPKSVPDLAFLADLPPPKKPADASTTPAAK